MGERILAIGHKIAVVRRHLDTGPSVRSKPCDEIKLERLLGQAPIVISDPATGGLDYLTKICGGGGLHQAATVRTSQWVNLIAPLDEHRPGLATVGS